MECRPVSAEEALALVSADLGYYVVGGRAGNAFRDGAALK